MKAFVLHKWPYSESDWIVEFFLESGGIQRLFAKSARRSKKRYGHQFHPAGFYEVEFDDTRLKSAELQHFFEKIPAQLERWARWLCILEWIRADEAASVDFTELLDLAHRFEGEGDDQLQFHSFFALQLYRHGLLSQLEECLVCQGRLNSETAHFSFIEGGLCHRECREGEVFPVEASDFLVQIVKEGQVAIASLEVRRALESCLVPFLEFQLGKRLKSFQFLQKIRGRGQNSEEKSWQNIRSPMF